jgi:arginyl-tRNA--protein-N-Asp/Glu arginylyltransferase
MDEKTFNPDTVTTKSGIYIKSFYREGTKIDTAIIEAGIAYYTEVEKKNTCEHCKKCNATSIEYKAWLVAKDLKKAGWQFVETAFFKEPEIAIAMSAMGF